jgi:hypothetical protein
MTALGLTLAVAGGVVAPGVGLAQDKQDKKKRAPKVIQLEEIQIEGRVQKPNAFYILNRSNLGYEVMELRTSFVQEVVRAVQRKPF